MTRIWIPEAPGIIIPGRRYNVFEGLCPPPIRVAGFFSVELVHARSGVVVQSTPPFENLVVDAGLNALAVNGPTQLANYCAVGTGNTPPDAGQVGLVAEVAPRTANNGGTADETGVAADNTYVYRRITRVFGQADANGVLTELGMFQNAAGAPMYARQLIKDAGGSATSITKTSEYELRVTYEIRVYTQPVSTTYSALIDGVATDITCRSLGHASWLTSLGSSIAPADNGSTNNHWRAQAFETQALDAASAGASNGTSATSVTNVAAYVAGNFYREATCEWNAATANFATGLGKIQTPGVPGSVHAFWFQHSIPAPKPTKTNLQKYVLVQRLSWSRYP